MKTGDKVICIRELDEPKIGRLAHSSIISESRIYWSVDMEEPGCRTFWPEEDIIKIEGLTKLEKALYGI
jgi:hypothetical protein